MRSLSHRLRPFFVDDWYSIHAHSALFFFLMIRRPPRSTLDRSSAASDVYKRQIEDSIGSPSMLERAMRLTANCNSTCRQGPPASSVIGGQLPRWNSRRTTFAVSYTHLRAHETVLDIVCRLLLEKKNHIQP